MRLLVACLFLCSGACAGRADEVTRPPETQFLRTMPSPDGCYVQIWAQPQFRGPFDYINGPRSYADLRDMPRRLNWDNRIVSVRSGPTAVATAYTERNFQGTSLQLGERKEFATLPEPLDQTISSLHVRCAEAPDPK